MSDSIAFPNLGIYLPHVIKSFSVFGYEIAVYGITMALGILAGMYMAVYVAKKTGQDADDYMNLTLIGIFTGLICARAYYVIFSWDYYRNNLLEISYALLKLPGNDAEAVLGWPDCLKLRSCMTLFKYADPDEPIFQQVLDKYYGGRDDSKTVDILGI